MSGYVLPEGWSIKRLDELARVTSGKRLPKGRRLSTAQTDHPYIRVTDMFMGGVDTSDIQYVPDEVFPAISRFTVDADDIFISCAGTLGLVGIVPENLHGANLTENANRISSIECDPRFLLSVLMSDRIQSVIQNTQTVGAQPKLALGRIRNFEIPCPDTLPEQQAIAAALSDADEVVAGLERVIAKKRLIKQGAMQDLLTARRRLPGFSGGWGNVHLGACASVISKGTTPTSIGHGFVEHGINFIKVESLLSGRFLDLTKVAAISEATHATLKRSQLQAGDILISIAGAIGRVGIVDQDILPANTNQALAFVRLHDRSTLHPEFVPFVLESEKVHAHWADISVQGAQPNISLQDVRNLNLPCPPYAEQQAIAAVLSDMDAEIQTLESRLTKARAVKEGMMQNLLTGRVRLV